MMTFTITYRVPVEENEEGSIGVRAEGHENQPLMEAHEWGHAMARIVQALEDYYLKSFEQTTTPRPTPEQIRIAKGNMGLGMICEAKSPTTYKRVLQ